MRRLLTYILLALCIVPTTTAQVVLVKPRASAVFLSPDSPDRQIDTWNATLLALLRESGLEPIVEEEAFLTSNAPRSTIILHHADCLSDDQIKALHEHLNEGNGLWITSAPGYRDENGAVRGWEFPRELTGGSLDSADIDVGAAISLQMRYGKPGSSALPAGYRLRLAATERPLCVAAGDSEDVVGYWATEKYLEQLPGDIPRQAGMIARSLLSGGRVVWMGSGMENLLIDPVNKEMALKCFGELVRWLEGGAIASVEVWPDGRKCAVLVYGDINDKFDMVGKLIDVFKRHDIPATYNIQISEAARFPKFLAEVTSTRAELGFYGDKEGVFAGQPYQSQLDRFKAAAGFFSLHGPAPVTFRPPEAAYDENTIRAARNAGITSFLVYDKPDRDYPTLSQNENSVEAGMVFFPKSELDDREIFARLPGQSEGNKSDAFIGDFRRIYDLHGLYKLSFHSSLLADSDLPRAVEESLVEIKQYDAVWFGDAKSIAQWVKLRSRLVLQSSSNKSTVQFTLTNTSSTPARDVVLRIIPPQDVPAELLVPREVSENCQYDVRDGIFYADIPVLKPGAIFKMELGSSEKHALSVINKKILITGLKAFAALAAIFILWIIMYLAFSGKKIRSPKAAVPPPSLSSDEEKIYRQLGLKRLQSDLPALDAKSSVKPSVERASLFPVIPEMPLRTVPLSQSEHNLTVSTPPFTPGLGESTAEKSKSETTLQTVEKTEPAFVYKPGRISKIPTLPMVLKPLTVTIRPQSSPAARKNRPKVTNAEPDRKKASTSLEGEQSLPAAKSMLLPSLAVKESPRTSDEEHGKSAATTQGIKRTAQNSKTFKSPSGLRTTANIPTLKPTPQLSAGKQDFRPSQDSPRDSDQPVKLRTSTDIIRKSQSKISTAEEWR